MRIRALPLAACVGLLLLPWPAGTLWAGDISGLEEEAPVEDIVYDYGDAEYVPPSPVYYAVRGAATASDSDIGANLSAVAGVDLEQMYNIPLMRFEIELNYLHQPVSFAGVSGVDASGFTGFVSLYRDLAEFYSLRPYVGAGVGVGHIEYDGAPALEDESQGVAWHVTTGISMDWNERMVVDLGYRYTGIEGLDVSVANGPDQSVRLDHHAVFAGLRFRL